MALSPEATSEPLPFGLRMQCSNPDSSVYRNQTGNPWGTMLGAQQGLPLESSSGEIHYSMTPIRWMT